jgi:polyisoprenoid-binding protein YceI
MKMLARCCLLASFLISSATTATERYKIDPEHTYSVFEYSHWGLSLQRGRFDRNSGSIEIDFDRRVGSVLIEIDANSVSTGSAVFDTALKSSRFFDTVSYPKISFSSETLVFDSEGKLIAMEGELKIKNLSKTVRFELSQFNCRFMPLYLKTTCGGNGSTKILRSDFDLGRFTPFVSDEVTLYFSVEAIKE